MDFDLEITTTNNCETEPEVRLWTAVIIQLFKDLQRVLLRINSLRKCLNNGPVHQKYEIEVRHLISISNNQSFQFVCDAANVDVNKCRSAITKLVESYNFNSATFCYYGHNEWRRIVSKYAEEIDQKKAKIIKNKNIVRQRVKPRKQSLGQYLPKQSKIKE